MFVVVVSLCHLLVYPKNLSKKNWKRIDYIWLITAAIGLLTMASDVRVSTANHWVGIEESRAISSLEEMQDYYGQSSWPKYCNKFFRSQYSPNDLEERQRQEDLRCAWVKSISGILNYLDSSTLPKVEVDDFPLPDFKGPNYLNTIDDFKKSISWYGRDRRQALRTKSLLAKSDLENMLFYLSPFFLCLALGLRIAKVTGEIAHEKNEV